ncbi:alpha,alpha-trehalase TreF [Flavilitoribacter nigricans]|uniref:Trehalase n=1 Tax=Flavilitoribacter nigricans (strain ATCC 23147 / DSM 23189 / NBRC 102662 / NCIMB 1420 / SS-2) TaxID=1122177 RepID=A0A2D0NCV0_FLAN2|nr:alpha,alpha-trehalase TreF [Flavilitoribacter nigricans]PHN06200.1 trehalase [Flavilitoribacter nigricans DSM 23189 = NBRC 102662]
MRIIYGFLFILFFTACRQNVAPDTSAPLTGLQSPEALYGELFVDVQMAAVFPDGKTFVDCSPKMAPTKIVADYQEAKQEADFDLEAFVLEHFELPHQYSTNFKADTSRSAAEHINALWPVLTREPDDVEPGTLIPLPNSYIVPGGRFGEIYYWDSYFTMLGLQSAGKVDMIENMIDNFAYLIDTIGFIPNGNRTYFLTRSQPPFFAAMVDLLAGEKGPSVRVNYLPALEKEYAFWMNGMEDVSNANPARKHVVRLKDGSILNRYWDEGERPRAEMYRDDVETAKENEQRTPQEIYSDLRAACESGWDFSSRWLADGQTLNTIQTTEIIPVDLNALLYNLELQLQQAYAENGQQDEADLFAQRAQQRRDNLIRYCWNPELGFFMDYNFVKDAFTATPSLAGLYPLFFGMAEPEMAEQVAQIVQSDFLKPGGVVSTLTNTGQQWDAPNGWAPLQWITIKGLRNYGRNDLADTIKERWVDLNVRVYKHTGKMVEKYNVLDMSLEAGGGEYPVQDGFGWTNGVLLRLLQESPTTLEN